MFLQQHFCSIMPFLSFPVRGKNHAKVVHPPRMLGNRWLRCWIVAGLSVYPIHRAQVSRALLPGFHSSDALIEADNALLPLGARVALLISGCG